MLTKNQYKFLNKLKKSLKKITGDSKQLSLEEMEKFCEKNNKVYPFELFRVKVTGFDRELSIKERRDRINEYLQLTGLSDSVCIFDATNYALSIEGYQNMGEYKLNNRKQWHVIIADCMAFAALVISIISLFLKIPE